jgi:3,4-dihydroxy 2-butanone 4-phosphate synthase/GTP cyclohydrolase II
MDIIGEAGAGIIVMLIDNSPDRLKQLVAKKATFADVLEQRDYGVGAQILADLGVHDMILLTNSHRTYVALDGYGMEVVEQRALS